MDIIIRNALIYTGIGSDSPKRGNLFISNGHIDGLDYGALPSDLSAGANIIDGAGLMLMPGVINGHCHGCSSGPLFPSGSAKTGVEKALRNVNRMLAQGVTTLINMCGLSTMEETEEVNRIAPVNVKSGTGHTPSAIGSALMVDGRGLDEVHRKLDVEKMLESGAVAIGEIGSGASLGGGVVDYKYIPEGFLGITGVEISPVLADKLKIAVSGRDLKNPRPDMEEAGKILNTLGIQDKCIIDKIIEMVGDVALKPVALSLESFEEACQVGEKTGYPVVFHNSLVSAEKIIEMCKKYDLSRFRIVAGHSNHPSFTPEESVRTARRLKELGAVIDISSLDCIITRWMNGPENIIALAREGLIDTISTDYGGGHWDGILETVHYLINRLKVPPEKAVAMATGNVAEIFPRAAENRGVIRLGAVADLVLCDEKNPGRVEKVIIAGKVVYDNGFEIS